MIHSEDVQTWLGKVIQVPRLHIRLLETLSYLENVGAHKIMAYQPRGPVSVELLRHAAEEARHAYFFKRAASRLQSQSALCNESFSFLGRGYTRRYLHLLDLTLAQLVESETGLGGSHLRELTYLLTTYTVELRATWLYTIYEKLLREQDSALTLAGLLKEEKAHLSLMSSLFRSQPLACELQAEALTKENELFAKVWAELKETNPSETLRDPVFLTVS